MRLRLFQVRRIPIRGSGASVARAALAAVDAASRLPDYAEGADRAREDELLLTNPMPDEDL